MLRVPTNELRLHLRQQRSSKEGLCRLGVTQSWTEVLDKDIVAVVTAGTDGTLNWRGRLRDRVATPFECGKGLLDVQRTRWAGRTWT